MRHAYEPSGALGPVLPLIAALSGACGARSELRVGPGALMDAAGPDVIDAGGTDVARNLCGSMADGAVPPALQGVFHLVSTADDAINLTFAADGTVRWCLEESDNSDAACGCWSAVGATITATPLPGADTLPWPTETAVSTAIPTTRSVTIQPLGGGVLRATGVDTRSHVPFADDWLAGGVCLAPRGGMAVPCAVVDPLDCP